MKKLIIAFIAILAIAFATPQQAPAQVTLNAQQRTEAVKIVQKTLPMEVSPGMTWTKFYLSDQGTVLNITFKLNERKMGVTLADAKRTFKGMTNAQFKNMMGSEFFDMMKMYGTRVRVTFVYSDNTSTTFTVNN